MNVSERNFEYFPGKKYLLYLISLAAAKKSFENRETRKVREIVGLLSFSFQPIIVPALFLHSCKWNVREKKRKKNERIHPYRQNCDGKDTKMYERLSTISTELKTIENISRKKHG